MPEGKVGIEETLDWVRFFCKIGIDTGKSLADDGKITWSDSINYADSFLALPEAIAGSTSVISEIKDLDPEEIEQIRTVIVEECGNIPGVSEDWQAIASEALLAAHHLSKGILFFINRKKGE